MKSIVILGSTGSIGKNALNVVAANPGEFKVVGLTAHSNHALLLKQIEQFSPEVVALSDPASEEVVRKHANVKVLGGQDGLCEVASHPGADMVISSIVGAAGLRPTLAAIETGKRIGIANKETLVVAGEVVLAAAQRSGSEILPIDSEHSALFQCIEGRDRATVRKLILTASGGPFVGRTRAELESVTPAQALKHPSWSMGSKISIDSATLMNKGLEVIEAHWLFGVGHSDIDVLVHPQSIIHSMVEFCDGGYLAQLSVPDMRAAIAYAMSYPKRLPNVIPTMDLASIGKLTFGKPDTDSFPCLELAYKALRAGGTMPAVLNAANEAAVEAFLNGQIGFTQIAQVSESVMDAHKPASATSLSAVESAHHWAMLKANEAIATHGLAHAAKKGA